MFIKEKKHKRMMEQERGKREGAEREKQRAKI